MTINFNKLTPVIFRYCTIFVIFTIIQGKYVECKLKETFKVYKIYPNSPEQLTFLKNLEKNASKYDVSFQISQKF